MESVISIRQATAADSDAILTCLHAAFAPYKSRYTPEGYEDTTLTPATLVDRMREMSVFVAIAGRDEIVGTIACGGCHLRGMAVLPSALGKGVAPQLLEAAEAKLKRDGCRRVTLDTTEPLDRAMHFYEKHGYRKTGRVTDFFGMPLYEYAKTL